MLDMLENSFFENAGYRLKRMALVLFAVELILGAISAVISFFSALINIDEMAIALLLIPVGYAVLVGAAWLTCLPLYAFGELLESNYEIEKNTRPEKNEGNVFVSAKKTAVTSPSSTPAQVNYLSGAGKSAPDVEHLIYCPACGIKNKAGLKKCWSCDAPLR